MDRTDDTKVVDEVVGRLVGKFPGVRREVVLDRVTHVMHDFDASRVRDFVPVLVEREVADQLRASSAVV